MITKKKLPRGIRNNNPLNIRIGNVWLGEVRKPTDREFEQFISMEYGLRAAFVLLRRYIRHYHLNTIEDIVKRWAPSSENNTQKYIDFVAHRMQYDAQAEIVFEDAKLMYSLVMAMAYYECGQEIPFEKVRLGYSMA